ncbi:MAG: glycoside hydrolase family 3 N-terminal domain-containing protein [Saprospiraceae bacterium]
MDRLIEDLLSQMSVAEKVGQMTQLTIDTIAEGEPYDLNFPLEINAEKLQKVVVDYHVGSILNVGPLAHTCDRWRQILTQIQESTARTRLKIPLLYGIDSIHGANYVQGSTLFPQQLGLAASWNLELVAQMGEISAYETRAAGIPWAFSPVLDLGRNQVWPRLWESFGEDVHLTTAMGLALLKGMQGSQIGHPYKVAACLKHFLGYGVPLSGKDRTPAYIPERQLLEYHVPAFAQAISAGAASVMINSGEINGIPVHANPAILTTLLREKLGFKGVAMTDWEDIQYLHTRHRIAKDQKEAVRLAIMAGIDMSMVPLDFSFTEYLIELVEEGVISEERINTSVRRILQLKFDLGLFEQMVFPPDHYPNFGGEAFKLNCLEAARESLVLCKNENNILPLKKGQTILVTGPTANSLRSLNGGWTYSWQGELMDELDLPYASVYRALQSTFGVDNVLYEPGTDIQEVIDIEAAVKAAELADTIVLCLGESSYTEFFGNIDDLSLDKVQVELANALAATGKPMVLIMLEGRPRLISQLVDKVAAVVVGFCPGNEGGQAVADLLIGAFSPSGKLPITYPKHPNGLSNYDYKYAENLDLQGMKGGFNPQFEFGFGLSYTTFAYENLRLSQSQGGTSKVLEVQVDVLNTGTRMGKEVVQLYLSDLYASITPSIKRLKAFQKVSLAPGERQTLSFTLSQADLSFVGVDNQWIMEAGAFKVEIGGLTARFELQPAKVLVLN